LLVGIVPGGLIVDEHLDMILFGEGGDAIGVLYSCREWFFHHDGDTFWGADPDDAEVFDNGIICEDGVGMLFCDEGIQVGVK
jgi:hypothetical protein